MKGISPVFFKELGQIAVSRRSFVIKILFVIILFTTFLIGISSNPSSQDSASFGRGMFTAFSIIELVAVILFTPVITAGMVSGEKEANTLGLLFLTRLKAWNIVQDKGLSRITYLVYLCLLSLPFMFGALLYGGVEPGQIVMVAGNVLSAILFGGGLGLLCSTLLKKFTSALACMYTVTVIFYMFVPMGMSASAWTRPLIPWINPFASIASSLNPYELRVTPWVVHTWSTNLALGLLVYILSVAIAAWQLRRATFGAVDGGLGQRVSFLRRVKNAIGLMNPARLLQRGVEIKGNPVAWKESNLLSDHVRLVVIRLAHLLFFVYLAVLLLMARYSPAQIQNNEEFHIFFYAMTYFIAVLFTITLAAGAFSREREAGTLQLLLSTRLTGRQIVRGVFAGLARPVGYLSILVAIVGGVGCAIAPDDCRFWPVPLNLFVFMGCLIVLSMFVSLRMKSTAKAVAATLGIVLAVTLLPLIMAAMMDFDDGAEFFAGMSPIIWIIASYVRDHDFIGEFGGFPMYLFVLAVYASIGWLLINRMMSNFDRQVGRHEP